MSQDDPQVESKAARKTPGRSRLPEAGLFERMREWNDVLPWLRLGRTLRLAGSPPLVLITCIGMAVWWLGEMFLMTEGVGRFPPLWTTTLTSVGGDGGELAARLAFQASPSSLFWMSGEVAWWRSLLAAGWSLLVWAPIALLLTRQGALLTAGRSLMSLRPGVKQALMRTPRAWLAAIVPSACATVIGLLMIALGKVSQWTGNVAGIEMVVAILISLVAIICGLLVFGASFAVPLSWAALANEPRPDPLDSLSRGYEYLLRRPLHVAAYLALSLGMLWVVGVLAQGVAAAATAISVTMLYAVGCSDSLIPRVVLALAWFPTAVAITLGWGLMGGIYLLLRCDAGGQEVEDIWIPRLDPQLPLPSLAKK